MKRVCLIIPDDKSAYDPMVYPPLGILYIAASLIRNGIKDITISDLRSEYDLNKIPEAEFYMFSAVTPQYNDAKNICKQLRNKYPKAFYVIGGPHVSNMNQEWHYTQLALYWDAIVVGEGESAVIDLISRKQIGIYRKNVPIDKITYPARHLLHKSSIVSDKLWEGHGYGNGIEATTMITSRGCPYNCAFCANIPMKVRFTSIRNVMGEIHQVIEKYNVNHFRFLDDHFTMNLKRLEEFTKAVKGLNISYRCSARSDKFDERIAGLLLTSGCKEIGFGIESADQKVLDLIKKDESVDDHMNAIRIARRFGLKTKAFFMAGLQTGNRY